MRSFYSILVVMLSVIGITISQSSETYKFIKEIPFLEGEKWWGGAVNDGKIMPFEEGYSYDMYGLLKGNQAQPLLLSNKGRLVWSENPYKFSISEKKLVVESIEEVNFIENLGNIRNAFEYASKNFFPPSGTTPDLLLFEQPQYNTWIELIYDQNQEDVLKYAHAIIDNGFPPGVLMIDDNWQEDYGNWRFHPERFPAPKEMMKELHDLGFKVMVWVCPFVSPDSDKFRSAASQDIFLKYPKEHLKAGYASSPFDEVAIVGWWNGYSALLDFSNPKAMEWFKNELQYLVDEYQVDGFKLDAGDAIYYPSWLISAEKNIFPNRQSELFAEVGLEFPLNEYRATWKMAGQPIAQRLRDKGHSWDDLQTLIPNITTQGLMGYAFTCPDMIGGGEFGSFINNATIDQDLIVRSAQLHALMPMMQFSVAPWRILDEIHFKAVKKAVEIRKKFTPIILDLAKASAHNGMPIVRNMEFVFPGMGYEQIKDQFFLGDEILIAPIITNNQLSRKIILPPGKWKGFNGKEYKGDQTISIAVELETLPYFEKIN